MTASYSITFKKSAEAELRALPEKDRRRVVSRILGLSSVPRPAGCKKLAGTHILRIRQGDYRILYSVDDSSKTVDIIKIGDRKEVYR